VEAVSLQIFSLMISIALICGCPWGCGMDLPGIDLRLEK
jgi:hypothetical protein